MTDYENKYSQGFMPTREQAGMTQKSKERIGGIALLLILACMFVLYVPMHEQESQEWVVRTAVYVDSTVTDSFTAIRSDGTVAYVRKINTVIVDKIDSVSVCSATEELNLLGRSLGVDTISIFVRYDTLPPYTIEHVIESEPLKIMFRGFSSGTIISSQKEMADMVRAGLEYKIGGTLTAFHVVDSSYQNVPQKAINRGCNFYIQGGSLEAVEGDSLRWDFSYGLPQSGSDIFKTVASAKGSRSGPLVAHMWHEITTTRYDKTEKHFTQ